MPVIRMDALAEVYAKYSFSVIEQEKQTVLDEGIENVLLRLRRYMKSPAKYELKAQLALKEIDAVLERFYYQDSKFSKLLHEKAVRLVKKQSSILAQGIT
jgi:hypothetical protein